MAFFSLRIGFLEPWMLSRAYVDHPEISNASFRLTCKSASSANGHRPPVCVVVALGRWEREEELQHSPQPSEKLSLLRK